MKEDVYIKIIVYKKGTPIKEIRKLMKALEVAWEETRPGEKLICIPVEGECNEE